MMKLNQTTRRDIGFVIPNELRVVGSCITI